MLEHESSDLERDYEDDGPAPDLGKISEDHPISPSEDVKTYTGLIRKVAASLSLSIEDPKSQISDIVFEVVHRETSPVVALPFSSVLLQAVQATWVHPASAPTFTKQLDQMYHIQEASA